jgi:glucokinase
MTSPDSEESARRHLVFDVGGTNLRAGLYQPETRELSRVLRRRTPSIETMGPSDGAGIRSRLYAELARLAGEVLAGCTPAAVAVAFAGPIDPKGRVLAAPTVWGTRQGPDPVPLQDDLRRLWPNVPVWVLNDVTAAGYRYMNHPHESFCVLTVSSGIGHKVFIDGKPAVGPRGHGGEIGHLRVDFSSGAPSCDCGGLGHLGAVASGRGAVRRMRRLAHDDPEGFRTSFVGRRAGAAENADNQLIAEGYRAGDPWICKLIQGIARPLAQAVAGIHLAVGVERFVIVGGFAAALGSGFRSELCKLAAACTWNLGQDWGSMIEVGEPDDEACLVGAGRFAELQPCPMP